MWSTRLRLGARQFYQALFPDDGSPLMTSTAVFVGVFIGVLPTVGIALPLTALAAKLLRLPVSPALVASFVANPATIPFFYGLGYLLGKRLVRPPKIQFDFLKKVTDVKFLEVPEVLSQLWSEARPHLLALFLGTGVIAVITAAIFAVASYLIIVRRPSGKPPP